MDYEILNEYLDEIEELKEEALTKNRRLRKKKNHDIYHWIDQTNKDMFSKIKDSNDYSSILKYRIHKKNGLVDVEKYRKQRKHN